MSTGKPDERTHVLVVDHDPIVRSVVVGALRAEGYRVSEAQSGEIAVELATTLRPDIITMDILMPPGVSGIDATRRIVEEHPEARVVMFSVHDAENVVAAAVAAGATSYITKTAGLHVLLDAVGRAVDGQSVLVPAPRQTLPVLTNRDRQILEPAMRGLRSREIAEQLGLSVRTVENHLSTIYLKLGVRGRGELANKVAGGEITPDGVSASRTPTRPARRDSEPTAPDRMPDTFAQLSAAEQKVARLVAEGITNQAVAERLFISRHTVDAHLRSIFVKLGVRRRVELASLAAREKEA